MASNAPVPAPEGAKAKRTTPKRRAGQAEGSQTRGLTSPADIAKMERLPPEPLPSPQREPATMKPRVRPKRHPDFAPSHPGALLREIVVPGTGRGKSEIARLLGVSRQTLYDVLSEKAAVTPQLAARLGKLFGNGPEFWLRLQAAHDVWTVARDYAGELERIPTLAAAE